MHTSISLITAIVLLIAFAGCATPMPPTGVPPDRTPPEIISMSPESGSVNVDGRTVHIEFSKWVDQRSFENALDVTPEPQGNIDFRWRRKSVEITFPEALMPNTTYVLTIGTDFRDYGGNRLAAPVTVAFSTGPTINKGRITGLVLKPERGNPIAEIDVYAYRRGSLPRPDSLPARPSYRTQTGNDGRFSFEYLSEEPFFILALADANRNYRVDPGEAFAVPPLMWIVADSAGTGATDPWIAAPQDLDPPEVTRVRALSNRRLEVRYNESVPTLDRSPASWTIRDSTRRSPTETSTIYGLDSDPRSVFVELMQPLPAGTHIITTGEVADSSGNVAPRTEHEFVASAAQDTTTLRFLGFVPDSTVAVDGYVELDPDQLPGVRFSLPPSLDQIRSLFSVSDSDGPRLIANALSENGTTLGLLLDPPLAPGDSVSIQLLTTDPPVQQNYRMISPSETGEISGTVAGMDTISASVHIELYEMEADEPYRSITADEDGAFMFTDIPGGSYRLRFFVDHDGSGSWTGGQLYPFRHSEPVSWRTDEITVRPRWETALPEPLSFSIDRPLPEGIEEPEP